VVNLMLEGTTPLKGYAQRFGDTSLTETVDLSIYSIGLALQPDAGLASIETSLGTKWPVTGHSTSNADSSYQVLGLQSDQVFVLSERNATLPELDESAYITDQSDSWVGLRIQGGNSLASLERICPIDLHPQVFSLGCVTRTTMEHLAVIIICEAQDSYLLLSPTSSAQSFLHAVETSIRNVKG